MVKIILESSKIEINLQPGSFYRSSFPQVSINGEQKQLESNQQLIVKQQQQPMAVIKCTEQQCEIDSGKHGLYVKISMDRIKVEVNISYAV